MHKRLYSFKQALLLASTFIFFCCQSTATSPAGSFTTSLVEGAADIPVNEAFTFNFNSDVDTGTVNTNSIFIVESSVDASLSQRALSRNLFDEQCDATRALEATVSCSSATSCSITPNIPLDFGTTYTLCLTSDILFSDALLYKPLTPTAISFTTQSQPLYVIGGTVTDLDGTITLQNNGEDDLTLNSDGSFEFETGVASGSTYEVTVLTQPDTQTCVVTNGEGIIGDDDISNIDISCADNETTAAISVTGSPLELEVSGDTGTLIITNLSTTITALNIESTFTGTALDGNVLETGNSCATLAPSASCTLTYTPDTTLVASTSFSISGTNTNTLSPAISIVSGSTLASISSDNGSASGGGGFTLTGTNLTGATSVTFDGVAATSINVVNSTTVTGVTPAHAAGTVDVAISTPAGGATLSDGYRYDPTVVGQESSGGIIGCLGGGLNNLISHWQDNSAIIQWGGAGIVTSAQSNTDGATNTDIIITVLGANSGTPYAAQLCANYEIDSQGNNPCQAGNQCYSDWFLPAKDQLNCFNTNRIAIGNFTTDDYLSSTENAALADFSVWKQNFSSGTQGTIAKGFSFRARCARSFTP